MDRADHLELAGALGEPGFEAERAAKIAERQRGLAGEQGEQVAVLFGETADEAFDIGVKKAQQHLIRNQGRDQ
ncbi:MAG: hypothetical protein ABIQ60_16050, partial [Burkholderiaceae bacterium]